MASIYFSGRYLAAPAFGTIQGGEIYMLGCNGNLNSPALNTFCPGIYSNRPGFFPPSCSLSLVVVVCPTPIYLCMWFTCFAFRELFRCMWSRKKIFPHIRCTAARRTQWSYHRDCHCLSSLIMVISLVLFSVWRAILLYSCDSPSIKQKSIEFVKGIKIGRCFPYPIWEPNFFYKNYMSRLCQLDIVTGCLPTQPPLL